MDGTILLCVVNLAFLGSLPFIFFRPGRLTRGWWLNAMPFFMSGFTLVAAMLGFLSPFDLPGGSALAAALDGSATVLAAGSIALIAFTLGTHQRPVSMWQQEDDPVEHLVTYGAYARVRHPFYAAFILMLLACVAALPHPLTAAAFFLGYLRLARTAAREERRFLASSLGTAYAAYMLRTGRFAPRTTSRDP